MTQFALHAMRDGNETVCRVQTDLGADTAYVLCAPVVPASDWGAPIPRLHLALDVADERHLILMSQMVALPRSSLGPIIGTAADLRDEIVRAVDLLVTGF